MGVNFFHFSDTPVTKSYFSSSRNVILTEFFYSVRGSQIFCLVVTVFSHLIFFFLQVKLVKAQFFGKDFTPACRKGFSVWWKLFFLFCAAFLHVETITETSLNKFLISK